MTKVFSVTLIFVTVIFFSISPQFIQGGDTAELVNASYHLFVPHPPGYPLFLWLQHFWTHLLTVSTVFWRASILNSIFGIGALYFLTHSQRSSIFGILILLSLASQTEFIEASVLPDVFALHGLLVAAFCWVYFYKNNSLRFFLLPFLFFLSASNHHTVVFLLPCLLHAFWEGRKVHKSRLVAGSVTGCLVAALLYLSLFLCHTDHPFSWGNIDDIQSLASHILRKDYGTFKLSAHQEDPDGGAFQFLITSLLPYLGVIIFSLLWSLRSQTFNSRSKVFTVSIIFTLFFPLFMNVSPEFMGQEVLRRFHVMPLILLMTFVSYLCSVLRFDNKLKWVFGVLFVPILVLNFSRISDFFNLRNDSIIEDYSRNLLKIGTKYKPVVIFADNDSSFFGLRYFQSFHHQDQVIIVAPSLLFYPWYLEKLQKEMPGFNLLEKNKVFTNKILSIRDNVIKPNLSDMNFVMIRDYTEGDWYKVIFSPLGRVVLQGRGVYFDPDTKIDYQKIDFPKGPQSSTKSYLYWQYSFYYMARAFNEEKRNNLPMVKAYLEEAVRKVPYAKDAIVWLCDMKDKDYDFCLPEKKNEILNKTRHLH